MMCFLDKPRSISALQKQAFQVRVQVHLPVPAPAGGAAELASTYFPPQKSLVVMTRLERLQDQTGAEQEGGKIGYLNTRDYFRILEILNGPVTQ